MIVRLARMLSHGVTADPITEAKQLFEHKVAVLRTLGVEIKKHAAILDYGCGAGNTVIALRLLGYANAVGFDIVDYLDRAADKSNYHIDPGGRVPFPDGTFDLIISDEVFEHVLDQDFAFAELYRVLKPGGVSIHVIPGKYQLVEPHVFVPLGGLIGYRWWYRIWAMLGIRNQFQKGKSASQVARLNAAYYKDGLNYVGNLRYRRIWRRLGFQYYFAEREYMETSHRNRTLLIARIARFPPVLWAIRACFARVPILRKPVS